MVTCLLGMQNSSVALEIICWQPLLRHVFVQMELSDANEAKKTISSSWDWLSVAHPVRRLVV
jgi:hypothetical protein